MKTSQIILVLLSPFLLVSLVLACPFYLLHWAIDNNSNKIKLIDFIKTIEHLMNIHKT